jgi:hypothetical protein
MAAVLLGCRAAMSPLDLTAASQLVILVLIGSAVYVACCLWRAPEITAELRVALGRRRSAAKRALRTETLEEAL